MSYDLRLFKVPEGVDARLVYTQLCEQEEAELVRAGDEWRTRSLPDSTRTQMQELADALKGGGQRSTINPSGRGLEIGER